MKKIARINSTSHVIQACLCTIRSILQVTQRVPPTCIIKTDFTYLLPVSGTPIPISYLPCSELLLFSNNPLHFVAKYVLHFSLPWLLPRNHMMSSPSETSSNCSICLIWPFSMAISTFFRFTTIEWSAFKDLRGNLG